MDIPYFNHLPIEEHFSSFQLLVIMNKGAMHIQRKSFFISLEKILKCAISKFIFSF